MRQQKTKNARKIERIARGAGADLVGFADLRRLRGIFTHPDNLLKHYPNGISIAVGLDKWARYDSSTEDGFAFPLLEDIAVRVKNAVEKLGYSAKVILPDKRVAKNSPLYWRGEISHKAAAKAGGLGWIGRSTLLVTPELGPRVCLVTVLTDLPVTVGTPTRNKCGSCSMCILACPRKALKGASFADHPEGIERAINVKACGSLVNRTWKDGSLCFECVLACPKGKRRSSRIVK